MWHFKVLIISAETGEIKNFIFRSNKDGPNIRWRHYFCLFYLSKLRKLHENFFRNLLRCEDFSWLEYIMFPTDFLKKKIELLKFGYFHFSVSSSTLTASWQSILVSGKPSRTILLIDRSKPRFESHTGGKIRKISMFFLKILG